MIQRAPAAPGVRRPLPEAVAPPSAAPPWDPLLICLAGYILTAVGRVHQLFPALDLLKPLLLTSAVAVVLYLADTGPRRRLLPALRYRTTQCALALLLWAALSVPGALWPGGAFQVVTDALLKTVLM
ncbi:MAG: hypothetical protein HY560_06610, partial [Gemmatimonadetes bacterium]|nr:hypothetical protein [Gemmatimonadota bacterium]